MQPNVAPSLRAEGLKRGRNGKGYFFCTNRGAMVSQSDFGIWGCWVSGTLGCWGFWVEV